MRLLIIRHGESEADILHVHEGRADFELTEKGHRQAKATAEFIAKNYNPDRIIPQHIKACSADRRIYCKEYGCASHTRRYADGIQQRLEGRACLR